MKPKISDKIYTINKDYEEIYLEKVEYLGENDFIIEHFMEYQTPDNFIFAYNDYNLTWFTTLKMAKSMLGGGKFVKKCSVDFTYYVKLCIDCV